MKINAVSLDNANRSDELDPHFARGTFRVNALSRLTHRPRQARRGMTGQSST